MLKKGTRTKQIIIHKSLNLFSLKGYYNTSVQDILEATNLTKGGLYGHFKSKEDIWYAAYDEAVTTWTQIVFQDTRHLKDPLERIDKVIDNDLRNYLGADIFTGGCFFLNMLVELSGQSDAMGKHVRHGISGFSNIITKWLEEADDKGLLKSGLNIKDVSEFIIVSLNGCAALYPVTHDPGIWKLTLRQIRFYIRALYQ